MIKLNTSISTPAEPKKPLRFRNPWVILALTILVIPLMGCYAIGFFLNLVDPFDRNPTPVELTQSAKVEDDNRYITIDASLDQLQPIVVLAGLGKENVSLRDGVLSATATIVGDVRDSPDVIQLQNDGYLAIRVPHAPPAYTPSLLRPPVITFLYRTVPDGTLTSVPVTLTRRPEYEAVVNAAFPITDGQSHWEVWWLAPGAEFPLPDPPYELHASDNLFQYNYMIGFPAGNAPNCAGCIVEHQLYNGSNFIGPHTTQLVLENVATGNPLATFGQCGNTSLFVDIVPNESVTHNHCLINGDSVSHTFQIDSHSSENWSYQLFTCDALTSCMSPTPLVGNQITVPPSVTPGSGMRIMAVYTPTVTVKDNFLETFNLMATSTVNSDVTAETQSWASSPGYMFSPHHFDQKIFLPFVVKN